jgi:hypothetical protein
MYEYNVEIKDDAPWVKKQESLRILEPILIEKADDINLLNRDEIIENIYTLLDSELANNKEMAKDFTTMDDNYNFWKVVLTPEKAKEVMEILIDKHYLKRVIEFALFLNKAYNVGKEEIKEYLLKEGTFTEETVPKNIDVLRTIYNSYLTYSKTIITNYPQAYLTEAVGDVLVDNNLIKFSLFESVAEFKGYYNIANYMVSRYINSYCHLKNERKKIINFLSSTKDMANNDLSKIINEYLLAGKKNAEEIKTEWLEKTIDEAVDSDEDEEDDY